MDVLPKDIACIVNRYVFDYNYSRLMKQYVSTWIKGRFYWDGDIHVFRSFGGNPYIANWRLICSYYEATWGVYNMYTGERLCFTTKTY